MLVKVESGKDIFELNPELKAVAAFSGLTTRQMTYVALVADYKGPFRKQTDSDRKFLAALEAGYKLEKGSTRLDINGRNLIGGKVATVEAAIRHYMKMQRDEDHETWRGLKVLIAQITELNLKEDKTVTEMEKAIKFTKDLPALLESKKNLEALLNIRDEGVSGLELVEDDIVKEDELSTLDLYNDDNDN